MKHTKATGMYRLRHLLTLLAVGLLTLMLVVSCSEKPDSVTDTLPDTIETLPLETPTETDTTASSEQPTETPTEAATEPHISAEVFPDADIPDYGQYTALTRVQEILRNSDALVMATNVSNCFRNDALDLYASDLVTVREDGTLLVDADFVCSMYDAYSATVTGMVPAQDVAAAVGKELVVYDGRLAMFFDGSIELDPFHDMYTFETMYIYLSDGSEEDLKNAFIDLPDRVSNGKNNAIYYTAPDLNLGIQSSVYFAQLGEVEGVLAGPCIVAGEGFFLGDSDNEANHTIVRVLNEQQAVVAQFLAFDPSVTGGVQVAAASVGGRTLIATAPFVAHDGKNGDVRVFDTFGTLCMEITLNPVMTGSYTILTGHFAADVEDEVLLVMSQTPDSEGKLDMALISLADGSVISRSALDCSFAKAADGSCEISASVRSGQNGSADSVILFLKSISAVYEGDPQTASFANSGITLPDNATGVYASANAGERYIVTFPEIEGEENRSFVIPYTTDGQAQSMLDVAFRENVFYSARYTEDNDDKYVSAGSFQHIRTDLGNGVMGKLAGANGSEQVDAIFASVTYADFAFGAGGYADAFRQSHMFLEPCFTHRWNKIAGTARLQNYVNPYTGAHDYISIGKNGEAAEYLELDSSFFIGTYADGIIDMAKLRIYPLRSFLRAMAVEFRGENGNPEHLVGVSPVHEQEIDVAGSVGDYNVHMIEGFRYYLMEQFGSLEQINETLGTTFATFDEIDPPRGQGRGEWDKYEGAYFTQWSLYNRYIVNKRIMEAYREALIAGYPPESISAHSIPEGDAVGGFLGEADTRLSPIDVVLTCGTAYGGTRYGYIANDTNNWINVANRSGQWNISIGEYASLSEDGNTAFTQLRYLWNHGVRMLHHITFNDAQATAEAEAIAKLAEQNLPRPGYTGGTTSSVGVNANGKTYNIIQIGDGDDMNGQGLLKSVNADGTWEGTVYVVPFHAHVNITTLDALNTPMEGCTNLYSTGKLGDYIKNSDQVEITLKASYSGAGSAYVRFSVYNTGCEMPASVVEYKLDGTLTPYRYVLSNQLTITDAEVRVEFYTTDGGSELDLHIEEMLGTLQQDAVGIKFLEKRRPYKKSNPHVGGVTFDLIDRDLRA